MRAAGVHGRRRGAGQATVEIALVGLVFIITVIGLIESGRAVWNYNTVAQAAREGARYAVVHGSRSSDPSGPGSTHYTAPDLDVRITEMVRKYASGLDATNLTVTAQWPDGTNERGARVKVTARYGFESMFTSVLGLPSVALTSSSTMVITY
jgi:Flp pilus assembly protein TadG